MAKKSAPKSEMIKLEYVGKDGAYVVGCPRRDIQVTDRAVADKLIETGVYKESK